MCGCFDVRHGGMRCEVCGVHGVVVVSLLFAAVTSVPTGSSGAVFAWPVTSHSTQSNA